MKRFMATALMLALALPLPALGAERMKGYDYGDGGENYTVEQTLEAPNADVVLLRRHGVHGFIDPTVQDYELWLCWENDFKKLILPSTVEVEGEMGPLYPTHRPPDKMELSQDCSTLTYAYSFDDVLLNAQGETLHNKGSYLYSVALSTGELTATHNGNILATATGFFDVSPQSWFAPYVEICVEAGLMKGTGAGTFSPNEPVTRAEAITLAARVHHILNGGDGKLSSAPEDYGILKVSFENGTTLQFDSTQYRFHPVPMSSVLAAELEGKQLEAMGWLELGNMVNATIALGDGEPAPCLTYRSPNNTDEEKGYLSFRANYEGTEEEKTAFGKIEGKLRSAKRPPAGDWFRDTVYYLESVELADRFPLHFFDLHTEANRADFIGDLNEVAEELLEPINHISDFPDSRRNIDTEAILGFYNAGILTGKDEYGTFDPDGTLTRAECAAMAVRLIRPELRLSFQPTPAPEKYGYTLTYLMDDPMQGHTTTSPVLPIITGDGANNGFLTLDGELIPWPGGQEPISIYPMGDYIWCSFWVDGVEQGGLMDKAGIFVLPLQSRFYYAYSTEGGFVASTQLFSGGSNALLDNQGQVVKELGELSYDELEALYPRRFLPRWSDVRDGGNYYVDGATHPVSEDFDWVGALTDDGRGFVGKDGKIYCIQFFEK